MSDHHQLPPVPSSLSKPNYHPDNLSIQQQHQFDSQRSIASSSSSSTSRKAVTIDSQLEILKREMYNLRQIDLALLAQLWSLNESIQEFRTMQEQEITSPQSPSSGTDDNDSNEDKNNNFSLDKLPLSTAHEKDLVPSDNDIIIEGMHKKLEKQITKMKIAPPAPPRQISISRPV